MIRITALLLGLAVLVLVAPPAAQAQLTTLATFNGTNGGDPTADVTLSADGTTLYGTTESNGINYSSSGTVFSVPLGGGSITTLTNFSSAGAGQQPEAGVTLSADGTTLYGTTLYGGVNYDGVVYSVPVNSMNGPITTLATFANNNGEFPTCELILSRDGKTLYGVTSGGGANGDGTVFSVPVNSMNGPATTLATFNGGNGKDPYSGLTLSADGKTLYGTAAKGGAHSAGTIFSVPVNSINGPVTTLASINPKTDGGSASYAGLILSADGKTLYGTTDLGGPNGDGNVFSVPTSGGSITTLATFNGTGNGNQPSTELTLFGSTLYGTTFAGGANNEGTIFSMPVGGGNVTTLVTFNGTGNGSYPSSGLTLSGTTLYGTTSEGGTGGGGTVYSLNLAAAPEPSEWVTMAFTLIGIGGLMLRAHRRKSRLA